MSAGEPLTINGRFLTQTLSGVQRFATEMTTELLRQHPGRVQVLGPPGCEAAMPAARAVGRGRGQAWEQVELPWHAKGSTLINLGNTAPVSLRRQIVVIHDAGVFATPEAYSRPFRLWYQFMQRLLVLRRARIVTVSQFARGQLIRHLRAPADIAVICEGADHMHRIAADRSILARFPPGRFVLVVGNLAAHKNLAALSELATRLAARGIALVITGGLAAGPFRPTANNQLPQPAHYIGRVSDGALKALYDSAACLVFPTRYEGFGLPAIEAMACGCAVAVARIPALQEVCGHAAQYFDPDSPADIADQVCALLNDAERLAALRSAAGIHVAAFTWARAAAQLAAIA